MALDIGILITADARGVVSATRVVKGQLQQLDRAATATEQRFAGRRGLTGAFDRTGRSALNLRNSIILLGASFAAVKVVQAADAYRLLGARLAIVADSAAEAEANLRTVFDIAQETRQSADAVGTLFFRLQRVREELGASDKDITEFVRNVQRLVVTSGTTVQEARNAIIQLSQGLASTQLRGEELRAVMEQLPALAQRFARSLGVGLGEFRKLSLSGKVAVRDIFFGLNRQTEEIVQEFEKIPRTVGQSLTQLGNTFTQTFGEINKATGFTDDIVSLFDEIRKFLEADSVRSGLELMARAFGALAETGGQAIGATRRIIEGPTDAERLEQIRRTLAADEARRAGQGVGGFMQERMFDPVTRAFELMATENPDDRLEATTRFVEESIEETTEGFEEYGQLVMDSLERMGMGLERAKEEVKTAQGFLREEERFARLTEARELSLGTREALGRLEEAGIGPPSQNFGRASRNFGGAFTAAEQELGARGLSFRRSEIAGASENKELLQLLEAERETRKQIRAIKREEKDFDEAFLKAQTAKNLAVIKERDAIEAAREAEEERLKAAQRLAEERAEQEEQVRQSFVDTLDSLNEQIRLTKAEREGREDIVGEINLERDVRETILSIETDLVKLSETEKRILKEKTAELLKQERLAREEEERERERTRRIEQAQREAERIAEQNARLIQEPFLNAIEGIQDAFTDMFEDLFNKELTSFEDFADSIKQIFVRMLAELATLSIARPIIGPLAGALGLGGGAGGAIAGAFGGGGAAGTGGLGGVLGAGSLLGAGGLSGFPILNIPVGLGAGGGAVGGTVIGPGIGQAGLSTAASPITLGGVLGAGGIGFGLGTVAGPFLGLNSTATGIGAGLGAGLGFAAGGPIGGLAGGAVGGILGGIGLDSFFGGKKKKPEVNFGLRFENGEFVASPFDLDDNAEETQLPQLAQQTITGLTQAITTALGASGGFRFTESPGVGLQAKDNQIRVFVNRQQVGSFRDPADAIAKAVGTIFSQGVIAGIDEELIPFIKRSVDLGGGLDAFVTDLELIRSVLGGPDNTLAKAFADIIIKFDELAKRAEKLGLPLDEVTEALGKQQEAAENALFGGLLAFQDSLKLSGISPLTPVQRLDEARAQFDEIRALAEEGDINAINALPGVAQQFLAESSSFNASSSPFQRDFQSVLGTVDSIISTQKEQGGELAAAFIEATTDSTDRIVDAINNQTDQLKEDGRSRQLSQERSNLRPRIFSGEKNK